MTVRLLLRDTTLRDGHQSLFATRMSGAMIERLLPLYRRAGFYALEVWGGAVPDAAMRFLGEDPWRRLDAIKSGIAGEARLTALSRGRNLFGYEPYPDRVIEPFCQEAVSSGIGIMRIFDALNDTANVASTVRFVKAAGGLADCAVCYTTDPPRSWLKSLFGRGQKRRRVFTGDYFLERAREMQRLGADMITIKDMAGLIDPATAYRLVARLKRELDIPVDFHTHCTPGFGTAATIAALAAGADIIDGNLLPFSGGPAGPALEVVILAARHLDRRCECDWQVLADISAELVEIRRELASHDKFRDRLPPVLDLARGRLPGNLYRLVELAAGAARARRFGRLQQLCLRIERLLNYPPPNLAVRRAQIPGGMYSNMLAQLEQLGLGKHLKKVIDLVPRVRADAGMPPLVTPTSQIVGVQAVAGVVDQLAGRPLYSNVTNQFRSLVAGRYGRTPLPVDPELRRQLTGSAEPVPFRPEEYSPPANPVVAAAAGLRLATDRRERLLLELLPHVARPLLEARRRAEARKLLWGGPLELDSHDYLDLAEAS